MVIHIDVLKLSLWARMITSDLHDDYKNPPNIPAFQGSVSKKCCQQSNFSDALSGAVKRWYYFNIFYVTN